MSARRDRDRVRREEPPRPSDGGRPVYEVRCFFCGRKLAEKSTLRIVGVKIRCKCGRLARL